MTRFLVATASRETTEAACDYLEQRVEAGDEVYVLTVEESGGEGEDEGGEEPTDAGFDVARTRLAGTATVRTIRQSGSPDRVIVLFARERDMDEIIVGPHTGTREEGISALGSTARAVLRETDMPVFVVGR